MDKNDILIVKVNQVLNPDEFDELRKELEKQREEGILMLPPNSEVISAIDTASLMEQKIIII